MNGTKHYPPFLYYNGSLETFSNEHTPFAVLAILMMSLFNAVPLIILYLYPCCCFQKLLNQFSSWNFQAFHIFMDTFLSNFRTEPIDCRYFAAIYLTIRVINLLVFSLTLSRFYYPLGCALMLMAALLVALFQPYKSSVYNKLDMFFFATGVLGYLAASAYGLSAGVTQLNNLFIWTVIMTATIPVLYITGLLVIWATPHRIKYKLIRFVKGLMQQQPCPDNSILEATDAHRPHMISRSNASQYTALRESATGYKSYGSHARTN